MANFNFVLIHLDTDADLFSGNGVDVIGVYSSIVAAKKARKNAVLQSEYFQEEEDPEIRKEIKASASSNDTHLEWNGQHYIIQRVP